MGIEPISMPYNSVLAVIHKEQHKQKDKTKKNIIPTGNEPF
jgi:hypothetical protein